MHAHHALSIDDSAVTNQQRKLLDDAISKRIFPGFACMTGGADRLPIELAGGAHSYPEIDWPKTPVSCDTVFDVAGLTEVISTTSCVMRLVEAGKIGLTDRVTRYLDSFGTLGKSNITVENLLQHSAGLSAWHPFHEELVRMNARSHPGVLTNRGAREYVQNAIHRMPTRYGVGERRMYSDIGFIVLGELIERVTGWSLEKAVQRLVLAPLALECTGFIDLGMLRARKLCPDIEMIAPTEECGWRKRILAGEVHDDNAWAMGGVAGHAGLFSTARDVARFAREMLLAYQGRSSFLDRETVRRFWYPISDLGVTLGPLGWERPSRDNGLGSSGLSAQAVGLCSFTGCSLWLEPEADLYVVLLSNRIHPSRNGKGMQELREALHKLVISQPSGV